MSQQQGPATAQDLAAGHASAASAGQPSAAPPIDIAELAERVYRLLQRELEIERERGAARF